MRSSVREHTYPPLPEGVDRETLLDSYSQMALVRRFEEKTGEMYQKARIGGYCHLNLGEEATVVGFCRVWNRPITSTRTTGSMAMPLAVASPRCSHGRAIWEEHRLLPWAWGFHASL